MTVVASVSVAVAAVAVASVSIVGMAVVAAEEAGFGIGAPLLRSVAVAGAVAVAVAGAVAVAVAGAIAMAGAVAVAVSRHSQDNSGQSEEDNLKIYIYFVKIFNENVDLLNIHGNPHIPLIINRNFEHDYSIKDKNAKYVVNNSAALITIIWRR
jgi:hypothetical protein